MRELLADVRPGHALPRGFYHSEEVFAADLRLLEGRWVFAGHGSEIASTGDWIVVELGAESVIVVRGEDGAVRALANVCRHRGSRLCSEPRGHGAALTCPYHAWSYRLDGRLRVAREMPAGFDATRFGLKSLPVREAGGLIFASFGEDPPSLDDAAAALAGLSGLYDWPRAKIAARRTYSVAANWKLVMENYHECYHCGPAHPEFSVIHTLATPGRRTLSRDPDPLTGLADFESWGPVADRREVGRVMRSRLSGSHLTGSADGAAISTPMGVAGSRWDGLCVFAELGFLSAFLAYADHGLIYRFIPIGVRETQMEVIWLVAGSAVEGRDYDLARLTWLWEVTSLADKRIIERNQAGVASRHYEPGPFSLMEPGARAYVERYVAELSWSIGGDVPRGPHGL